MMSFKKGGMIPKGKGESISSDGEAIIPKPNPLPLWLALFHIDNAYKVQLGTIQASNGDKKEKCVAIAQLTIDTAIAYTKAIQSCKQ